MKRYTKSAGRTLALAALGAAATAFVPAVQAATAPDTVTVQAQSLQALSDREADLAAFYRSRAVLSSKHLITYFTLANRCDQLANRYQREADEASDRSASRLGAPEAERR